MPGERLLRKDAGDRDCDHLPAGSLHLRFFVPQLGQLLCSDRPKVEDVEVQQHGALRKAFRQRQHRFEAPRQCEIRCGLTDLRTWHEDFLLFVGVRSTSLVTRRPYSSDERHDACNGGRTVASRQGTRDCATTMLRVHFQERTCTIGDCDSYQPFSWGQQSAWLSRRPINFLNRLQSRTIVSSSFADAACGQRPSIGPPSEPSPVCPKRLLPISGYPSLRSTKRSTIA